MKGLQKAFDCCMFYAVSVSFFFVAGVGSINTKHLMTHIFIYHADTKIKNEIFVIWNILMLKWGVIYLYISNLDLDLDVPLFDN